MTSTILPPQETHSAPLVMYTINDKFYLKFIDEAGQFKPIKCISDSSAPFEIYQPFANDYVVIRKFIEKNKSKYFLLNPKTGEIPKESQFGIAEVKIDKRLRKFIVRIFFGNGKVSQSYKIASRFSNTETFKGDWFEAFPNVITSKKIDLEPVSSDQISAVQDLYKQQRAVSHQTKSEAVSVKRPVGRPRKIVDPTIVTEKRPRGRPKGSTNKSKAVTSAVIEKAPQITTPTKPAVQNRWERPKKKVEPLSTNSAVKIKETKRIVGGMYSDVYINGRKVLAQQLNVDPHLMLNDRILALTVDIEGKNDKEVKLLFANGIQWQTKNIDRLTGNPIRIADVTEKENQLKIALFNGATHWISEHDAGLNTTQKFGKIEIQTMKALPDRPMKMSKLNKPKSTVKTNHVQNTIDQETVVNTPTAQQKIQDKGIRLVRTESVPLGLNKTVYNVYINDLAVVHKHSSVTVKTFFDGTVLGVRGIDLQNVMGPGTSEWKLFLADKSRWIPRPAKGKVLYITNITETANGLNLKLSDSSSVTLYYDSVVPFKHPKKYQIQR